MPNEWEQKGDRGRGEERVPGNGKGEIVLKLNWRSCSWNLQMPSKAEREGERESAAHCCRINIFYFI